MRLEHGARSKGLRCAPPPSTFPANDVFTVFCNSPAFLQKKPTGHSHDIGHVHSGDVTLVVFLHLLLGELGLLGGDGLESST